MSKVIAVVGGVFAVGLIVAAALFGVTVAQAQDPTPDAVPEDAPAEAPPGEFSEEFHTYMREQMEAARQTAIDGAVGQGLITQEQADWLLANPMRGHRGGMGGFEGGCVDLSEEARTFLHDQMEAALASALGVSVEELEAAKAEGTRIDELAEANGVDLEALRDTMQAAHQSAVEEALAQGLITQEQADWLLEHPRGPGGGMRGSPGRGPRDGQWPDSDPQG